MGAAPASLDAAAVPGQACTVCPGKVSTFVIQFAYTDSYLQMVSHSMPEKPNALSPSTAMDSRSGRAAAAAMAYLKNVTKYELDPHGERTHDASCRILTRYVRVSAQDLLCVFG